jgi:hypothetical protein
VRTHTPDKLGTKPPYFGAAQRLWAAALVLGLIGVVAWFGAIDFYHRHFFDTGPIVAADNVARVIFVGIFAWLIYAPGAAIAALVMSPDERAALTPPERAVLGFGIGLGLWHVTMLILGLLGLYYRSVIVGLCLAVIVVSARHFANVAIAGWRSFAVGFVGLRHGRATPERIGIILIGVTAVWLLLLRGLFPGGGGDYYTHYFYYYLEVLKNHGLAPNDVWYHYYYSKGSGLAFLGLLLTDPEAPALTTYPCVVFAAVAIATLAARMAPNSLWPAAGAVIYLFYYLVSFDANGGGQFQKDHEEIAALVALTAWALCMERHAAPRPFRIMAAATAADRPRARLFHRAIGGLVHGAAAMERHVGLRHRRCRHRRRRACGARGGLSANRIGERPSSRSDAPLRRFCPARSLGRHSADHCRGLDQRQLPAMGTALRAGHVARDRRFLAASLSLAVPDRTAHRRCRASDVGRVYRLAADGTARRQIGRFDQTNRLASCCFGGAARGRCRARRAQSKSVLYAAQLVFCSGVGDAGNCRQRLGAKLAAGTP